jgi:hypothetical protein
MLLLPLILGVELAGPRPSAAWLVPPAALLAFLAHNAVVPDARRRLAGKTVQPDRFRRHLFWAAVYLAGAFAAFGAAMLLTPATNRNSLLAVSLPAALGAAAYAGSALVGEGRRIVAELVGMAALSLSAPITAIASGGPVGTRPFAAAAMAFAYSASALAFVRAYTRLDRAPVLAAAGCIAAHVLLLGGLAVMVRFGWLSPWWLLAFAPVVARTAWGLLRPPRTLRSVGLREIWVVVSFTVIATAFVLT